MWMPTAVSRTTILRCCPTHTKSVRLLLARKTMLVDQNTEGGRRSCTLALRRLRLRVEIVVAAQLVITIVWPQLLH